MDYRQPFEGEYPITQCFGEKITDPKGHTGIDYGLPLNTPVLAAADGVVHHVGFAENGYGYYIVLNHEDGRKTLYAHLEHTMVVKTMHVRQGEQIGLSGSTGNSTGPHLHFEIQQNGKAVDPMPFLKCVMAGASGQWSVASGQRPDTDSPIKEQSPKVLKGAEAFKAGETVRIVAPLGAKAFFRGFDDRTTFQMGSRFHYTGRTTERNGYTYMEVIPLTVPMWVAVNDGDTQILDRD